MELKESLKNLVFKKGELKSAVSATTKEAFEMFRAQAHETIRLLDIANKEQNKNLKFIFTDRGDFEFEIRFADDILIFSLHSNVFEFSRDHQIMKTPYIKEDPERSYCGIIHIYNFLADSFDYNRDNDLGYLIGRVFINKEKHYIIEGKREIGMIHNNFTNSLRDTNNIQNIIESAIEYTCNFDLLTPSYDEAKVVSVGEMRNSFNKKSIVTAKRLGFRFQADID